MVTLKSQYEWSYGHLTVKKEVSASSYLIAQLTSAKLYALIKDEKGTFLFYGHLKVPIWMKLWPSCSEIMEFLISSYCIVQLTSL